MRCDYHTHTFHSMDGHQSIAELCNAAVERGLDEICLTEHYEPMHPAPGADIPPDKAKVLDELERARRAFPRLSILLGIEIGDNPPHHRMIKDWLDEWPLDYRLMSLHLVGDLDPYDPAYFEKHTDREDAYTTYARAVLTSIKSWEPHEYDALAHLGYVGRYAPFVDDVKPFTRSDALDIVDEILSILARDGKALEINTSAYRQFGEPIPHPSIIKRFKELGGEFLMFGSDAHLSQHAGWQFSDAFALAKSMGFRHTSRFNQRKRTVIDIP